MNHINMINGHINACNEKWLSLESARDRSQDLTEVRDVQWAAVAVWDCGAVLLCLVSCRMWYCRQGLAGDT